MLFTFPSRYWFAIGRLRVFSLGRWSSRIRTGFPVSRPTQERKPPRHTDYAYGAITLCGRPFQDRSASLRVRAAGLSPRPFPPYNPGDTTPTGLTCHRFGLFRFRSPLLSESRLISFPRGTEMCHFPRLSRSRLWIQRVVTEGYSAGLPHSEIPGSIACLQLPGAYRSLPRPSSTADAKASTVRP